jgi:hypothetical protein
VYLREESKTAEARLRRLAQAIEALAEKDQLTLKRAHEIDTLRRRAAAELFTVCEGFVDAINRLLSEPQVILDPSSFPLECFREDAPNLIQINVRGRILQVAFEATPGLLSTEDFRIPYTLGGTIRAFNQALLDKDLIEEQLIFYTVERHQTMWRYFDARTYRSGAFDRDYLIGLLDQLL